MLKVLCTADWFIYFSASSGIRVNDTTSRHIRRYLFLLCWKWWWFYYGELYLTVSPTSFYFGFTVWCDADYFRSLGNVVASARRIDLLAFLLIEMTALATAARACRISFRYNILCMMPEINQAILPAHLLNEIIRRPYFKAQHDNIKLASVE